jgi:hypothetical protein
LKIKIEDNGIEVDSTNDAENMTAWKEKAVADKEKKEFMICKEEKELQSQKMSGVIHQKILMKNKWLETLKKKHIQGKQACTK